MAERIERSVGAAVAGERMVAVAFSGGVDSSILAACAARRVQVVACAGHSVGAGDEDRAARTAAALGVDFVAITLTKENVREPLSEIALPFAPTLMDRSLWCLYYTVSRAARGAGARTMLLGQLADELFGGYAKYGEVLRLQGEEAAAEMMESDVRDYPRRGRIRDVRACGRWVEPRFPFEEEGLVDFAMSLPLSFKMRDGVRKAVLRRAGEILGLPEELVRADKKAAQYSSGVQKLLARAGF